MLQCMTINATNPIHLGGLLTDSDTRRQSQQASDATGSGPMNKGSRLSQPFKLDEGIEVRVAHDLADLQKVMAIRAAVFMGEEDCEFQDEFDGNDLAATHLIAFKDGQPAGTFRIRWFAEFARFERLAIRKRFRSLRLVNALVSEAMKISSRKGYKVATGLARAEAVKLWLRHGGECWGAPIETSDGWLTPIRLPIRDREHNTRIPISISAFGEPRLEALLSHAEGTWPSDLVMGGYATENLQRM